MTQEVKKLTRNGWVDYSDACDDELISMINDGIILVEDIKNPSKELQLRIVDECGETSTWVSIRDLHPDVSLHIVKQNGLDIEFMDHQLPHLQLESVKQNGFALDVLISPDKEVVDAARDNTFWANDDDIPISKELRQTILRKYSF